MEEAPSLLAVLLGLVAGAAGVVYAGIVLAKSADVIATKTGLGGLWLGMVLLAFADLASRARHGRRDRADRCAPTLPQAISSGAIWRTC